MAQQEWFVVRGGKEEGPFSGQRLKEMAASGKLRPGDLVRRGDVETARPASAIKGLFPAEGAAGSGRATEAPTSPQPPEERPGKAGKKKWVVLSVVAGTLLLTCCGGFGVLFTVSLKEQQAVHRELAEADGLWKSGDKAAATSKYRALLQKKSTIGVNDRALAYGRLIDFDMEAGNAESAKRLLDEALSQKVTPQVNHPEAAKILARAEPSGADPKVGPDDDVFKDRLTARFLPCVPGNVKKYEEEVYVDGRSVVYSEYRDVYGKGNVITVEGTMKSPGEPATRLTAQRHVRAAGGYVEVGEGNAPPYWKRLVKLGAKPGDEWPDTVLKATFRLVRFERATEQGAKGPYEVVRAVIEHRGSTVTETVLEWDGGVQSEKEYATLGGERKLIRHKRLVASTTE